MSKLKDKFNVKSIFYLTTIIVILIGVIVILVLKSIDVFPKKVLTNNYNIYYDSTWRAISKNKNDIYLKHNTGSILKIKIINIDNYYKYKSINSSINNILYSINKNNPNIKLINKEMVKINNNDAYKVLYKMNNKNILVTITKISDKFIIFEYTAKNKYYDLVLDSANSIINSFRLSHRKIDMSQDIKLSKNNIKWMSNRKLNSKINGNNKYSISSNNYRVDYTIPDIFKLNNLDTTKNNFIYNDINISTRVENLNVYEYLNSNNKNNIYSNYSYLKKKSKFKEYLNLIDDNIYCYKNSYYVNSDLYENVELIYILNRNHIFIVKINSNKEPITNKLVHNINILKYTNYSSNTKRVIRNNSLIGTLYYFDSSDKSNKEEIVIKLPVDYKEIDHNNNMYDIRYYEKDGVNVKYYLRSNINSNNNSINKDYESTKVFGSYKNLIQSDNKIINDKEYIIYDGMYTNKNKVLINTKILYYKIKNRYLVIEVESNKDINDILDDITDIEI